MTAHPTGRHTCLLLRTYMGKSKPEFVIKAYVTWCIQHYVLHIVLRTGNWSHKRKGRLCQQIKWTFICTNAGHKQVMLPQDGPGTSEVFKLRVSTQSGSQVLSLWVEDPSATLIKPFCYPHQKEVNRRKETGNWKQKGAKNNMLPFLFWKGSLFKLRIIFEYFSTKMANCCTLCMHFSLSTMATS